MELISLLLLCVEKDDIVVPPVAQKLSEKVLANCATKLEPYLRKGVADNYITDEEIPKSTICCGIPIPKEDDSNLVTKHDMVKVQGNNVVGYLTSLLLGSEQEFKPNELLEELQYSEVNDMVENRGDLDKMEFKKLPEIEPNGLVETVEENFEFLSVLQAVQPVEFIFSEEFDAKHPEARRKIAMDTADYKLAADVHRKAKDFNVDDFVMVQVHSKHVPKNASKKLFARAIGPYPIMQKLGSNAYLLDLPDHYSSSPVFNVKDLSPYKGTFEPPALSSSNVAGTATSKEPPLAHCYEEVIKVLDDQFVGSKHGGFQRYLVQWKGCPPSDNSWLNKQELLALASALLEEYLASPSLESSSFSFQPGENDGAQPKECKTFKQCYFRRMFKN
ncbi:hypothetical protein SLEP1_g48820 [Rubroshorea leprosula]|nr:hypothetical protein SLEP1_g48820 [Rubroshorea leprosula]